MAQFDRMSVDLGGNYAFANPTYVGGLARRHPSRITKLASTGNSPRNNGRGDIRSRSGSCRRFSAQGDQLAASFYAALQKATASHHLPVADCQPRPCYAEPQMPGTCNSFAKWPPAEMSSLAGRQPYERNSFHLSFHGDFQQPWEEDRESEPESDWPTYIPMVSSTTTPNLRHYERPTPQNTTATSSPELFSYHHVPEPKTPPFLAADDGAKSDEVLVGVGLYDEPVEAISWEESSSMESHFGIRTNLDGPFLKPAQIIGKGLKLEETFNPPPVESDAEDDSEDEACGE
ncbi:predicted protein [Uncinocarpus reesii 1704]|uniref:Uncharacterized protein n=1 Tax=Uncinocarpus reesii (strain UAMH 1704) TaxID=336963 RepID=C4JRC0_UNCRE|nr:uncharacterized protein UREG_05009 [Uncinocarpus reesii 1704]EEP80167.1 predicted protein [Uncinocarpus reesii 1704]